MERSHTPHRTDPSAAAEPTTPSEAVARRWNCETKLRRVLRINAGTSSVSGAVMALAPNAVDDVLDTGRPGWVRAVGLLLVAFAAFVAWVSTRPLHELRAELPAIVAADSAWVVASVLTILLGWYSTGGVVLVVAVAATVATFAVLQLVGWRRTG